MSSDNLIKLSDGEIESGGNPEDPIYKSYILTLNGTLGYVGPNFPSFTSIDKPEWTGLLTLDSGVNQANYYFFSTGFRFQNTIIAPVASNVTGNIPGISMNFNASQGWRICIRSGWAGMDPTYIQGWYFKRSGWSFTGTYTLDTTYQNRGVISPTTITVTPVIP